MSVGEIGVWLSLVERTVRDGKAAGSNPVTPIVWGFVLNGIVTVK